MNLSIKFFDTIIFFIFSALTIGSIFIFTASAEGNMMAEVESANGRYLLPLSENRDLIVDGPVGKTHIQVNDGAVRIIDSDCRDLICVTMGAISDLTGWIACLPNRVFLRVIAKGNTRDMEKLDAGAF